MAATQVSHGTSMGYKSGCRCDACVAYRRGYDAARYQANKQRRFDQVAAWQAANRDKVRVYRKRTYDSNPAKAYAATRASMAKQPELYREKQRAWSQTDAGRARVASKNMRRRVAVSVSDEHTDDYIRLLLLDPCSYCGGKGGTVDHIVPLHAGGTNESHNLTGACKPCNSSKGHRDLLSFLTRQKEKCHA